MSAVQAKTALKSLKINKFKIVLPEKGAFTIPTEFDYPNLHCLAVINGKRGGGKSVATANFLRECKDKNYFNRVILISPTYISNRTIWDICEINEKEDVIETSKTSIKEMIKIVESERQAWDDFQEEKRLFAQFNVDKYGMLEKINGNRLMRYHNLGFLDSQVKEPVWKYHIPGKEDMPPRIACIIDDAVGTDLMSCRTAGLTNLAIKSRHIADGLGVSLFILTQTYRSDQSTPRPVRENCTFLCLFKIFDKNQIKAIKEEADLPITDEEFLDLCEECHKDEFQFLFIDFNPKCPSKRFRRGWNEYLIPPSLKDKCTCNSRPREIA
tara:strand:+ start:234 stop:1211 length:978 start_codon:yes stop_codon:yes gene_type:complete